VAIMTLIATVAFIKHLPNIKRIIAGTEPKLNLFGRRGTAPARSTENEPETRATGIDVRPETAPGP
jgi:hypothetical protein